MPESLLLGSVALVGAGPGDPDLLTRKAVRLLAEADLVLHDDLVSAEVLALAGPNALLYSVGKRCGAKRVTQPQTNRLMVEGARAGLRVVRLKSGDPLVFGRAAEEMDALDAAGVAYTVVPGITAAFAAAAEMRVSLTDRRASSSIQMLTGHRAADLPDDVVACSSPTRVVYMPGRSFAAIAQEWAEAGESPELPCVVVSSLSRPEQRIDRITLRDLPAAIPGPAPVLLLAGWALEHMRQPEHLVARGLTAATEARIDA